MVSHQTDGIVSNQHPREKKDLPPQTKTNTQTNTSQPAKGTENLKLLLTYLFRQTTQFLQEVQMKSMARPLAHSAFDSSQGP